jgi:hypothetical protein
MDHNAMRIAMKHDALHIQCMSNMIDYEYVEEMHSHSILAPTISIQQVATNISCVMHVSGPVNFQAIDATPTYTEDRITSLDDMAHFRTITTNELIVPDESVQDLLARIQEMQQPDRTEYYKRKLREDVAAPAHKVHAQIISLSDYQMAA